MGFSPCPQRLKPFSWSAVAARLKEAAEKVVAMEETADSSGLNFTPTSATTALVGDPGSPVGMTKIKGLQWRT
jgi:hypothetical protein